MRINHLEFRIPIIQFVFTFQIKNHGIVQKNKYVVIILQEHLDYQAGGNGIPLIHYFTEVWSYTKLQNRALRYILGVGPKTAMPAVYSEVTLFSDFSRHVTCNMYYTTMA